MSDCSLQLFANNAVALLDSNISPTDLTVNVQPGLGSLFPQPTNPGEWFLVTLEDTSTPLIREIVKIIGVTGDVLTVDPLGRGYEGSTAMSWVAGNTLVDHRVTAETLRCFQSQTIPHEVETGTAIVVTATETANTLDITGQNKSCKWLVTIKTADGRISMSEILAVYRPLPSGPAFTQYARVGDAISYGLNVIGTATEMQLNITNLDTSIFVDVDVIRLQHF